MVPLLRVEDVWLETKKLKAENELAVSFTTETILFLGLTRVLRCRLIKKLTWYLNHKYTCILESSGQFLSCWDLSLLLVNGCHQQVVLELHLSRYQDMFPPLTIWQISSACLLLRVKFQRILYSMLMDGSIWQGSQNLCLVKPSDSLSPFSPGLFFLAFWSPAGSWAHLLL